jgi:hypothetical protein
MTADKSNVEFDDKMRMVAVFLELYYQLFLRIQSIVYEETQVFSELCLDGMDIDEDDKFLAFTNSENLKQINWQH